MTGKKDPSEDDAEHRDLMVKKLLPMARICMLLGIPVALFGWFFSTLVYVVGWILICGFGLIWCVVYDIYCRPHKHHDTD